MDGDGVRPFAFATEMWPLLQKRCGACHGNPATAPVRAWDQGGDGKSARLAMTTAEEGYRLVQKAADRMGLPLLYAGTSPAIYDETAEIMKNEPVPVWPVSRYMLLPWEPGAIWATGLPSKHHGRRILGQDAFQRLGI